MAESRQAREGKSPLGMFVRSAVAMASASHRYRSWLGCMERASRFDVYVLELGLLS